MSGYYDGGHPMLAHPKEALPSAGKMNCRVTRTWMQNREDELRRHSYHRFYRIIFPPPIPILWFPPLARNEEVDWDNRALPA